MKAMNVYTPLCIIIHGHGHGHARAHTHTHTCCIIYLCNYHYSINIVHFMTGDRKQPLVPVREQTKESRTVVKSPPKANELEFSALKPPPLPFEDFKPENSQDYNRDNRSPEFSVLRPPPLPFENFKLGNSEESTPRAENIARKISIEAQEFTIAELQVATQSFAEENLIGEGVDAKVYKAKIADENVCVDFNVIQILFPSHLLKKINDSLYMTNGKPQCEVKTHKKCIQGRDQQVIMYILRLEHAKKRAYISSLIHYIKIARWKIAKVRYRLEVS